MRTLQQIFDLMIRLECYSFEDGYTYMCNSLDLACGDGVITQEERNKANRAISHYLSSNGWSTMRGGLLVWIMLNRPNIDISHRRKTARHGAMEIYKDWKRRPRKTRGSYDACMRHRVACWIADLRRQQND